MAKRNLMVEPFFIECGKYNFNSIGAIISMNDAICINEYLFIHELSIY